jgi:hypothetical protein
MDGYRRLEADGHKLAFRSSRPLTAAIDKAASRRLLSKSAYIRLAALSALKADGIEIEGGEARELTPA